MAERLADGAAQNLAAQLPNEIGVHLRRQAPYRCSVASFGYTLSSEEHPPTELVLNARRAEEAGFDFLSISDHFHPWVSAQGHSPFVWSVLGATANATERIRVGVGVTCPIVRIHPAILAQAAATTSLLFGGRFSLGVGTGEALNEHILGHRWPPADIRLGMLEEAVGIIRALWSGDTVDHRGLFYEVKNAKLFDPPTEPPRIIVSGSDRRPSSWQRASVTATGATHPTARSSIALRQRVAADPAMPSSTSAGPRIPTSPERPCTTSGLTVGSPANSPRTFLPGRISSRRRRW